MEDVAQRAFMPHVATRCRTTANENALEIEDIDRCPILHVALTRDVAPAELSIALALGPCWNRLHTHQATCKLRCFDAIPPHTAQTMCCNGTRGISFDLAG